MMEFFALFYAFSLLAFRNLYLPRHSPANLNRWTDPISDRSFGPWRLSKAGKPQTTRFSAIASLAFITTFPPPNTHRSVFILVFIFSGTLDGCGGLIGHGAERLLPRVKSNNVECWLKVVSSFFIKRPGNFLRLLTSSLEKHRAGCSKCWSRLDQNILR